MGRALRVIFINQQYPTGEKEKYTLYSNKRQIKQVKPVYRKIVRVNDQARHQIDVYRLFPGKYILGVQNIRRIEIFEGPLQHFCCIGLIKVLLPTELQDQDQGQEKTGDWIWLRVLDPQHFSSKISLPCQCLAKKTKIASPSSQSAWPEDWLD